MTHILSSYPGNKNHQEKNKKGKKDVGGSNLFKIYRFRIFDSVTAVNAF